MNRESLLKFTFKAEPHHSSEFHWECVANHRNDTHGTKCHERICNSVVAGYHFKALGLILDYFFNLREIS